MNEDLTGSLIFRTDTVIKLTHRIFHKVTYIHANACTTLVSLFLAPFKRGPGLYFTISPSQHSVPAHSWRPACLCLCLCRGCTACCWLPSSCIDPSFGLHHSTTCACYVLSPDAFTMKPVRFSIVTWTFTTVPEDNYSYWASLYWKGLTSRVWCAAYASLVRYYSVDRANLTWNMTNTRRNCLMRLPQPWKL